MRSGKIFHLGEEANNKTVKEIAEIVQSQLPESKIEMNPGKPSDRRDYRINCQKLKNIIGWEAEYSVEDGIKELIEKFNVLDLKWDADKYRNSSYEYV